MATERIPGNRINGNNRFEDRRVWLPVFAESTMGTLVIKDIRSLPIDQQNEATGLLASNFRKIDTNVRCSTSDPQDSTGHREPVILVLFEQDVMLGALELCSISIMEETDTEIQISALPNPGLSPKGETIWGAIHSVRWTMFLLDLFEHLLNTVLCVVDGKSVKLIQWDIPLSTESNFLNRPDVISERGGRTSPIISDTSGVRRTVSGDRLLIERPA